MNLRIIIMLVVILIITPISNAISNEYGFVNAWFDGKEANVEDFNMKIGEPGEIKIEIISKIDGNVIMQLYDPGVIKGFKVINGPSDIEKRIENLNIESGWTKTYTWIIAPNGDWTNGNAPINIFVKFYNIKSNDTKIIEYTIANPYILDEQYEVGNNDSTPILTSTPTPIITVTQTQTPTLTYTVTPTITSTVSPSPIATSNLEQEIKELRERLNKTEEKQSQQESRISWLENVINSIIDRIKSIF